MLFVTTVAVGLASFILVLAVAQALHRSLKDRWTEKGIDRGSAFFCLVVVGSPAYATAAFSPCSFVVAAAIHFVVGSLFVGVFALSILNWVEGFLLATVICILISILGSTF
jgi:hypothetical protein